ncbi:uncharacterized protein SAPINGB_P006175 [Magnusiomyces paraingens]|uniref:C2H2-type domain-containing protein n=1 Tax=Magnusiomyces paraingens TaxID=2606893 RepID=A0A5E8CAS2_9ASCO|nr:uncharacterized protein SAPINGB_P006175 [Saprochaete ingens]VVT58376.1 unnamed protein product [Saprochaete ingens]
MPKRTRNETDELGDEHQQQQHPAQAPKIEKLPYIVCDQPPTCCDNPTPLYSLAAYEAHYRQFHAAVCMACDKAFPSAHLLILHVCEQHDPITALRRDRGEAMLGCFVETCEEKFQTEELRKTHLIQVHGYPEVSFPR